MSTRAHELLGPDVLLPQLLLMVMRGQDEAGDEKVMTCDGYLRPC